MNCIDSSHDATVNAGAEILADAIIVNQFGAATNDAVTATPCDAKITAAPDTLRGADEFPERFRIRGVTLGTSCLVVSGGGISDTIRVRVVTASIRATDIDTVGSGESKTATLQFRDVAGASVSGLTLSSVRFTSLTTAQAVVDSLTGVVTGRAPGTARIVTSLVGLGATRVDTAVFAVTAGSFAGTISPTAAVGVGTPATFTASSSQPFDADTQITFDGIPGFNLVRNGTTSITAIVPGGAKNPRRTWSRISARTRSRRAAHWR